MSWFLNLFREHPKIQVLEARVSALTSINETVTRENIRLNARISYLEEALDKLSSQRSDDLHKVVDHVMRDSGRRPLFSADPIQLPPTARPVLAATQRRSGPNYQEFSSKHDVASAIADNLGVPAHDVRRPEPGPDA